MVQRSAHCVSALGTGALLALLVACGDSSSREAAPTPTASPTSTASRTPAPVDTPPVPPSATPTGPVDGPLAVLMENRAKWASIGAVRYRMLERVSCYCLFEFPHLVAIEARENRFVSIRDVWTGSDVTHAPENSYRTIDDLFGLIEETINSGADRVLVEYEEYTGVPIETYIDYERIVADDEMGFSISDLTIWIE